MEGGEGSDDLKTRLNQVEQLCQDVMEENEALKEEIEEMQREIEEMHDHFQVICKYYLYLDHRKLDSNDNYFISTILSVKFTNLFSIIHKTGYKIPTYLCIIF